MRYILPSIAFITAISAGAQGPISLTLKQAMDMAASQSYSVQAGELGYEKSRARINEVLAIGLPQIDASGSLNNYLEVPTTVVPNFFGSDPENLELKFGIPWTTTGGIQLNQLLFDGSYLVGLQATKELRVQSEQELEQSRADARAQAAKAYMGVLAAREGARLSNEALPILEKSVSESDAMVGAGFLEGTDSDRLNIALANSRTQARSFEQQARVALAYLRLVLGVPADTPIELTDQLETIVNDPNEVALSGAVLDLPNQVDHQLAETMVRLQTLDVKNQNAAYMPQLVGFLNYQQQSYGTDGPIETDWYPASMWGVNLHIPIWSSGMRANRVKQAKLTLEQTQVNLKATEQRIVAEAEERAEKTRTAEENYRTESANLQLAKKIFDNTSIKFTNGMSSSFELNQDQSQYLVSQQLYMQRLVDLLLARADLRRSLDLY